MSSWDDSELDEDSDEVPSRTKRADERETRVSRAKREHAIEFLGAFFYGLAVLTVAMGLVGVAETFRGKRDSVVLGLLEEFAGTVLPGQGDNGLPWLLCIVGVPVLLTILLPWLFYRLGSGLRWHSRLARWSASILLATACLPALVIFFQACWGRGYWSATAAAAILAFLSACFLLLTSTASDVLFTTEYRAFLNDDPRKRWDLSPIFMVVGKVGLIVVGLIVVIVVALLYS